MRKRSYKNSPPGCSERRKRNGPEQDGYFDFLIRDVLRQVRQGETDYVFSQSHIAELLKYEPNLYVSYDPTSGCYSVCL